MKRETTNTFIQIDNQLLQRKDLNGIEKIYISYLQSFERNGNYCYETINEIAEKIGVNSKRVQRINEKLIQKQIIKRGCFKEFGIKKNQYKNRKATILVTANMDKSSILNNSKKDKISILKIEKENKPTQNISNNYKPQFTLKQQIQNLKKTFKPEILKKYEEYIDIIGANAHSIEEVKAKLKTEAKRRKEQANTELQKQKEVNHQNELRKQKEESAKVGADEIYNLKAKYFINALIENGLKESLRDKQKEILSHLEENLNSNFYNMYFISSKNAWYPVNVDLLLKKWSEIKSGNSVKIEKEAITPVEEIEEVKNIITNDEKELKLVNIINKNLDEETKPKIKIPSENKIPALEDCFLNPSKSDEEIRKENLLPWENDYTVKSNRRKQFIGDMSFN